MTSSSPTLGGRLTRRLILVMAVAFVVQVGFVLWEYGWDTGRREFAAMEYDADRIVEAITATGTTSPALPGDLEERLRDYPGNYGIEIRDEHGAVLAARNDIVFAGVPFDPALTLDLTWIYDRTEAGTRRILTERIDDRSPPMTLRVAYVDDPGGAYWNIFLHETVDHVIGPGLPVAIAVVLVGLFAVRRALAPLDRVAAAASAVDPRRFRFRIGTDDLPAEVATLAGAIDRLLDRIERVTESHAAFAGNVAHELRTPLALLSLELDAIGGDRVVKAKQDVQEMARLVDQLLRIARLEVLTPGEDERIDLVEVATDVVSRLAPLAIGEGRDLALAHDGRPIVPGNREAVAAALRNLVENALRVTPAGGVIEVTVGPGAAVAVLDEGPGLPAGGADPLFARHRQGPADTRGHSGLGLAIVAKTMEIHGGRVETSNRPTGGASFRLMFPSAPGEAA